jgi:hypothetical protein
MVAILAGPFLGEWIGWRRAIAIGIGFAGVLVALRPETALTRRALRRTPQARRTDSFHVARISSTSLRFWAGLRANEMVRPVLPSEYVALTKEERNEDPQQAARCSYLRCR